MTRGGKNLVILGAFSIVVAVTTTVISLAIYHSSGDIYLDRSRPGFLPEEQDVSDSDDYGFNENGAVDAETIDEYLQEFKNETSKVNGVEHPFNVDVLSDQNLGI